MSPAHILGMNRPLTHDESLTFQAWRTVALSLMPYVSTTLMALKPLSSPGLGTFAVDKHYRCYIDFEAVKSWGPQACAEGLLHESMHLLHEHHLLAEHIGVSTNQQQNWNIAGDASINDDLVAAGCLTLTQGILPATLGMPDWQSAVHYFDRLPEPDPPEKSPDAGASGSGYEGCGSGSGGAAGPTELADDEDLNGAAPTMTSTERDYVNTQQAAEITNHVKSIGNVPGELIAWAQDKLAPSKIRWQSVLGALVRRSVAKRLGSTDVDYSRLNRRRRTIETSAGGKILNPSRYDPTPTVVVIRDTSGSMSQRELDRVTAEVEGISKRVGIRGRFLEVADVDTVTHKRVGFAGAKSIAEIAGRGGTDMAQGIVDVCESPHPPAVIVVITDGYTGWPEARSRIPVVACVIGEMAKRMSQGGEPYYLPPTWIRTIAVTDDSEAQ